MADHRLERLFEAGYGLFGRLLTARGIQFATLERKWAGNRPRVSCVRPGRYELVRWPTRKFKTFDHVYCLVGGDVGLLPGPGIARSTIEIHPANVPLELEGCIALGTLDPTGSMLTRSREAVRAFLRELDGTPGPHFLTIEGGTDGRSDGDGSGRGGRGSG